MNQAFVEPDLKQPYGHAVVRLPGAAAAAADPRFLIRREGYEKGVLGPGGWQVGEAHLSPLSANTDGNGLIIHLGPQVVDLLEPGTVLLSVPAAGFDGFAVGPTSPPLIPAAEWVIPRPHPRVSYGRHRRTAVSVPGLNRDAAPS